MTGSFLSSVVAALVEDGQSVVRHRPAGDAHGDPEEWRMSAPLDRGRVEAQLDLGPLAWWYVGPRGGWVLVDDVTDATLHGTGDPVPYDAQTPPAGSQRRRIGYLADRPDLRRRWATPAVDEELAALDGRPLPVRGPNQTFGVRGDVPPEVLLDRVREVLSALAGSTDLPPWFEVACAPRRTADEWVAWAREAYADLGAVERRREEARWTVAAWWQAMVPDERTWWVAGAAVADDHLRLTVLTAGLGARTSSLTWLLQAAGGLDLVAAPAPTTQDLVLPVLPASQHRDPDDALALAAHELLGVPDPVVLVPTDRSGGIRWEHRLDVPVDGAALERGLGTDTPLTHGAGAGRTWLTNGWSSVVGPLRGADEGRRASWWRR